MTLLSDCSTVVPWIVGRLLLTDDDKKTAEDLGEDHDDSLNKIRHKNDCEKPTSGKCTEKNASVSILR